jgi:2-C-methyl-D-erythritol 4-phosphate cytidylyltransferase
MPKVFAIVPAAGQGTRIGDAVPKQYLPIAGKPMMFHAIEVLAAVPRIACVCVVLSPLDRHWGEHDWSAFPDKIEPLFAGGAHRAETVRNAIDRLGPRMQPTDWVLVHDAARPCLPPEDLAQLIAQCEGDEIGGLLAFPVAETVKKAAKDEAGTQRVAGTEDRSQLWLAQTPQMFRAALLARALQLAKGAVTDEASAVEQLGLKPRLVAGSRENIKVTYPEDMAIAESILARRQKAGQ